MERDDSQVALDWKTGGTVILRKPRDEVSLFGLIAA